MRPHLLYHWHHRANYFSSAYVPVVEVPRRFSSCIDTVQSASLKKRVRRYFFLTLYLYVHNKLAEFGGFFELLFQHFCDIWQVLSALQYLGRPFSQLLILCFTKKPSNQCTSRAIKSMIWYQYQHYSLVPYRVLQPLVFTFDESLVYFCHEIFCANAVYAALKLELLTKTLVVGADACVFLTRMCAHRSIKRAVE